MLGNYGGLLRTLLEVSAGGGVDAMNALYVAGGLIAVGLLVYLFVALLKPESFS